MGFWYVVSLSIPLFCLAACLPACQCVEIFSSVFVLHTSNGDRVCKFLCANMCMFLPDGWRLFGPANSQSVYSTWNVELMLLLMLLLFFALHWYVYSAHCKHSTKSNSNNNINCKMPMECSIIINLSQNVLDFDPQKHRIDMIACEWCFFLIFFNNDWLREWVSECEFVFLWSSFSFQQNFYTEDSLRCLLFWGLASAKNTTIQTAKNGVCVFFCVRSLAITR